MERTTYCNIPWKNFLERTGITTSDLWPGPFAQKEQTLWNAKLFPVLSSCGEPTMDMLFWAFSSQGSEVGLSLAVKLERWRASWRYSLCDILQNADLNADFQAKRSMFYEVFARQLAKGLLENENIHYLPYFQSAVVDGFTKVVLEALDSVASTAPPNVAARTLALTADMLSCMARGEGGLRSGPAANEKFLPAFDAFENGHFERGVGLMRKQREEWSFKPDMLIRCARHYEGAAQICIRRAVMSAKQFISLKENLAFERTMDHWYVAECPARLDLSGGWTDTPPVTYENGGAVVNVAILIDGKRPIGAKVRRTESFSIILRGDGDDVQVLSDLSHFRDYCIPNAAGALLKACLILAEVVSLEEKTSLEQQLRDRWNCGFEVVSWSNLPQGSGLGTSSILAAAIIAALWSATGRSFDNMAVVHAVLCVEQMLTTGGGWQDQVGGVFGGVKVGTSLPQLPLQVSVQPIPLGDQRIRDLNSRLLVIYTGKPRLAKNLLQNVVRSWYSRDSQVVSTCESLKKTAQRCAQAFEAWNYETVCSCISDYYGQKKCMAAGTEPASVRHIIRILLPFARVGTSDVFAGSLAGAGGGGFLYCLLSDPNQRKTVFRVIENAKSVEEVQIFPASIDTEGLKMYTLPV
ncbi:hypothetical protein RvY_15894-2 [Ramazzottius varieornatus]|uniref:GHMP kinase N-terminal domain-containing protein n=1 Tax=Ramazzottius varieornatus TaxID=947166 RepID=A0A1D1W4B6_RAMVA|nr:hypothetical protein RvY_15894-2 [Ramazzottius varieornatus]